MPNKLDAATSYQLNSLVDYAQDAIVSRSLGKSSGGNLSIFAFDAGQELSEHSTPMNAWLQVLDGEVELVIAGKTITAKTGEIVLMPGGVPHSVKALTQFKMLLTLLKK